MTAHEVTIKFATANKDEAIKWYNKLKKGSEVVLLHLSANLSVGQMIYRGNFSKVNIATNSDNTKRYAVRSTLTTRYSDSIRNLVPE